MIHRTIATVSHVAVIIFVSMAILLFAYGLWFCSAQVNAVKQLTDPDGYKKFNERFQKLNDPSPHP